MILNLDPNFKPIQGGEIEFEKFTFSGGEVHIKIQTQDIGDSATITHRLNSFNDIGFFLIAVDALKRMGVKTLKAIIPYFPAARQDRVMIPGEPLTVKVIADLINAANLDEVHIFDAHSEVTPALLDNCVNHTNFKFISEVIEQIDSKNLKLVSPDGGALKKIYKVAAHLQNYEVVEGSKSRDVKTGKLSGFKVYTDDLEGADCLVIDDICDGGGTFLGLAKELKAKNAGKLYLAVSHGIFNRGFEALSKEFTTIFCTDSFRNIAEPNVVQINLTNEILIK